MAVTHETIHYFAYGSNLHPVRLEERVPSARLLDVVQVNGYCLKFHKKSEDGSSKCSLLKTASGSDVVFGALYEIAPQHKVDLDRFESRGNGYRDCLIDIHQQQKRYQCFTYIAEDSHVKESLRPYHWYKKLVVLGAGYLQFPESYVAQIEAVNSIQDDNVNRRKDMEKLIEKIMNYG